MVYLQKPDTYQILEDNFGKEQFGVGVRQTDKAFLQELDKALDAMKADGTAAEISRNGSVKISPYNMRRLP